MLNLRSSHREVAPTNRPTAPTLRPTYPTVPPNPTIYQLTNSYWCESTHNQNQKLGADHGLLDPTGIEHESHTALSRLRRSNTPSHPLCTLPCLPLNRSFCSLTPHKLREADHKVSCLQSCGHQSISPQATVISSACCSWPCGLPTLYSYKGELTNIGCPYFPNIVNKKNDQRHCVLMPNELGYQISDFELNF